MAEKSQMEQHLQNSVYGTPKINPDEQRHYLGTFRERVSLAMTIAEVTDRKNLDAFITEISAHPDFQVILNGHIEQTDLGPYMKLASQHNLKFTIKQDEIYGVNDTDLGLVVASDHAINENPILLAKKYPANRDLTTTNAKTPAKTSWLDKLLHH
ncbi:YueI family protein [Levilactobacillus yonginensis]|uniref:YueI family protein n=1 Tax=Levilactobacillus yonginensis TaxID=1054041 RepID=UPI000F79CFDF|nr:YueI family protein [Levilactobacillus yonginensis]